MLLLKERVYGLFIDREWKRRHKYKSACLYDVYDMGTETINIKIKFFSIKPYLNRVRAAVCSVHMEIRVIA